MASLVPVFGDFDRPQSRLRSAVTNTMLGMFDAADIAGIVRTIQMAICIVAGLMMVAMLSLIRALLFFLAEVRLAAGHLPLGDDA